MKIGILVAMKAELESVAARLKGGTVRKAGPFSFRSGSMGRHSIILGQCGIGKVNAAAGTMELIRRYRPDCILSTGVAGGLDPKLKVLDVAVGKYVAYHDVWCGAGNALGQVQGLPAFFEGDPRLYRAALSLAGEVPVHGGLLCTGDRFISERKEAEEIRRNFPTALAVDMESAAIAQICHLFGVPFLSFRLISDNPASEEENVRQYENFWKESAERSFLVTEKWIGALPAEAER